MYQVSLFTNTWSKSSTAISIEDFFAMVRNGYWKVPVEGHRNCLAKDRKHDAQTIKDSMASSPQAYATRDTQKTTLPPYHSHSASTSTIRTNRQRIFSYVPASSNMCWERLSAFPDVG